MPATPRQRLVLLPPGDERLTAALGLVPDDAGRVHASAFGLALLSALGLSPDEAGTVDADELDRAAHDLDTGQPETPATLSTTHVDPDTLAALLSEVDKARTIIAAAEARHRADTVETAVRRGKIAPASRQHWTTALANDPHAEKVLASLPDGLIPVSGEIGHANSPDPEQENKLYDEWFGNA